MKILANILILTSLISIIKNFNNNIILLISLELLFIGITLLFLYSSLYLDDFEGIITSILLLCISATESAIGLTLLIAIKKN